MRFGFEIDIEADIGQVWLFLDEEERLPGWMPEIVETRYLHGGSADDPVGARFIQMIRKGRRLHAYDGAVIAYTPCRHLAVRLRDARVVVDVAYRLQALGTGTRLHLTVTTTARTMAAATLAPLIRPFGPARVLRALERLKRLAEEASAGRRAGAALPAELDAAGYASTPAQPPEPVAA